MSNKNFNPYLQFAINYTAIETTNSKVTAEILASKSVLSSGCGLANKNLFNASSNSKATSMKGFYINPLGRDMKDNIDSREAKTAYQKTNKLSKLLNKIVVIDKQKQLKNLKWVDDKKETK